MLIYVIIQPKGSLHFGDHPQRSPSQRCPWHFLKWIWRLVNVIKIHIDYNTNTIHVWYTYLHEWLMFMVNVGRYTMNAMGYAYKHICIIYFVGSCIIFCMSIYIYKYMHICYYRSEKNPPVFWGISATSTKAVWYVWSGAWKNWFASWRRRRRPLATKSWPCTLQILKKNRPWESKGYKFNGLLEKTIVSVEIYHQQFRGTIILMVFDFQGRGISPFNGLLGGVKQVGYLFQGYHHFPYDVKKNGGERWDPKPSFYAGWNNSI